MSNCNWDGLRGYEEQVRVGAEVVNGTGKVELRVWQDPDHDNSEAVFLTLTADEALDFAHLLSQQAHEAMRVKWNEANILSG